MSDNVEHAIASLPVTVKLIDADDDVAAVRARVTVGALVSGTVVDVVVVDVVVVDVVDVVDVVVGGATVVVVGTVELVVVVEVVVAKSKSSLLRVLPTISRECSPTNTHPCAAIATRQNLYRRTPESLWSKLVGQAECP